MNICLFFEGTGHGKDDDITNVTRLYNALESSERQKLHLETGPGTHFGAYLRGRLHGHDWWYVFRGARRWFEKNHRAGPARAEETKVFLFGFSRGALIARHFAAWLDKLDVAVAYLGIWDTVDSTLGLDVSESVPPNVRFARHAIARDEARRLYTLVPLLPPSDGSGKGIVEQLVFPGSHTDVGGLYEDNHAIADASLAWIAEGAKRAGAEFADETIFVPPRTDEFVIHDSSAEASNLWGALGEAPRNLEGIPHSEV